MLNKNDKKRINNQIEVVKNWVLHIEEGESVQMHKNVLIQELSRLSGMIN